MVTSYRSRAVLNIATITSCPSSSLIFGNPSPTRSFATMMSSSASIALEHPQPLTTSIAARLSAPTAQNFTAVGSAQVTRLMVRCSSPRLACPMLLRRDDLKRTGNDLFL